MLKPSPRLWITVILIVIALAVISRPRQQRVEVQPGLFGATIRGEARQPGIIAKIQQAGITWVRMSVNWSSVEPVRGLRMLDHLDTYFLPYIQAGLQPVVFVADNPSWAASTPCGPIDIAGPQAMAELVADMAARWPEIEYWQLYNEPDYRHVEGSAAGCWGDYPTEYANLMTVVRAAMVAANPQAKLVFGVADEFVYGLFNTSFATRVMDAGGQFDVMDFHYYPAFSERWDAYGPGIAGKARYYRALLAEHGRDVPLMVTETGIRSDIVGDDEQSAYLVRTYAQAVAAGIICVMWFSLADLQSPETTRLP